MGNRFEDAVALVHKYDVEVANAMVEQKEQELMDAQTARHMLKQDDSRARKLVQEVMDTVSRLKTT